MDRARIYVLTALGSIFLASLSLSPNCRAGAGCRQPWPSPPDCAQCLQAPETSFRRNY